MRQPRSASASGKDFPYNLPTMCYIEVSNSGVVTFGDDVVAYERAIRGESSLYAVWPGNYSSDLFHIDDLEEYAKGKGIVNDPQRTGVENHPHNVSWRRNEFGDKPGAQYESISVTLLCGCEIRDIRRFADQMREQRGWIVATTGGWGSSQAAGEQPSYSIRVRRTSLR